MTLDMPVRTTRSRETYAGLGREFIPTARMIHEMIVRPRWLLALLRNGYPRFATIAQYAGANAGRNKFGTNDVIAFARSEMGGAFLWDEVARYRDRWKGPMTVKGILHPADAEKAVSLGIEGIWVSNHGGRQIEALVPTIDCAAGHCLGGRLESHHPARQRHSLRPGRHALAGARRQMRPLPASRSCGRRRPRR